MCSQPAVIKPLSIAQALAVCSEAEARHHHGVYLPPVSLRRLRATDAERPADEFSPSGKMNGFHLSGPRDHGHEEGHSGHASPDERIGVGFVGVREIDQQARVASLKDEVPKLLLKD